MVERKTLLHNGGGQSVIVVGGGISGHTAAYRLHKQGFKVKVLEANPSIVGGEMSSVSVDGYTFNRAATLLPSTYDQIIDLANDLGVGDRLLGEVPVVLSVPRASKIHRLRVSGLGAAIDGLTTGLLSFGSKLVLGRLGADVAKVKDSLDYEQLNLAVDSESLGDYSERRLNPEIANYMVGALMRGSYLHEPETLSVLDFFFAAAKFTGVSFMRYSGGFDFVNQALAKELGTIPGARVSSVEARADGVAVTWEQGGEEHIEHAAACIVAVPAWAAPGIVPGLTERQRDILANRIRYGDIIKASHALKSRSDDPTIMMSFPRSESEALGIITFDHNYRTNVTPDGAGLIASHWMHEWSSKRLDAATISDRELQAEMIREISRFIPDFAEQHLFSHITRWPAATVVSYAGMWHHVDEFRHSIPETSRIQFAGDYFNVPGTKAVSLSGDVAAERIAASLGLR